MWIEKCAINLLSDIEKIFVSLWNIMKYIWKTGSVGSTNRIPGGPPPPPFLLSREEEEEEEEEEEKIFDINWSYIDLKTYVVSAACES